MAHIPWPQANQIPGIVLYNDPVCNNGSYPLAAKSIKTLK